MQKGPHDNYAESSAHRFTYGPPVGPSLPLLPAPLFFQSSLRCVWSRMEAARMSRPFGQRICPLLLCLALL
eukprot:5271279-Pyramimonas_sp.AAC.1